MPDTARVFLGDIEMIHMMRKGQARHVRNPQPSMAGQFALRVA
jgi:hypothetical protein